MDVDLRRLRYFMAVARNLHFGRAAARLSICSRPSRRFESQAVLVDARHRLADRSAVSLDDLAGAVCSWDRSHPEPRGQWPRIDQRRIRRG